ncbi:hypothetical protein ACIGO9_31185 [Nocardia asteroides]|uniref:hypothetical protein n=1 Tax=Nocardia asteroides TaxID=1824 RepID=UPI0037CC5978
MGLDYIISDRYITVLYLLTAQESVDELDGDLPVALLTTAPHVEADRSGVAVIDVDAAILASSTLTEIGHCDAHLLVTDRTAEYSAEGWARAVMEDVPAEARATLRRAWHAIALRLEPTDTAHTVAGWPIVHAEPDYILLHAESALGFEGQLLFRRDEQGLLLATFVRFQDPAARTVWDRALPSHLVFVWSLLEALAGRL